MASALDPSDATLVQGCRTHDESAVRELTLRYNQRLFRIARGIVGNDAEAEDVVQDTYLKAFRGLDAFREESSLGTWLVRIAMNEAYARLRRRKPTVDLADVPEVRTAHDDTPEVTMAHRELRAVLERSIDELPLPFRIVFISREVEGLSVEETAALCGIRPETVKTRVHRARRRLRESIERQIGPSVTEAFSFDGERCDRLTNAVIARLGPGNFFPSGQSNGREGP